MDPTYSDRIKVRTFVICRPSIHQLIYALINSLPLGIPDKLQDVCVPFSNLAPLALFHKFGETLPLPTVLPVQLFFTTAVRLMGLKDAEYLSYCFEHHAEALLTFYSNLHAQYLELLCCEGRLLAFRKSIRLTSGNFSPSPRTPEERDTHYTCARSPSRTSNRSLPHKAVPVRSIPQVDNRLALPRHSTFSPWS